MTSRSKRESESSSLRFMSELCVQCPQILYLLELAPTKSRNSGTGTPEHRNRSGTPEHRNRSGTTDYRNKSGTTEYRNRYISYGGVLKIHKLLILNTQLYLLRCNDVMKQNKVNLKEKSCIYNINIIILMSIGINLVPSASSLYRNSEARSPGNEVGSESQVTYGATPMQWFCKSHYRHLSDYDKTFQIS